MGSIREQDSPPFKSPRLASCSPYSCRSHRVHACAFPARPEPFPLTHIACVGIELVPAGRRRANRRSRRTRRPRWAISRAGFRGASARIGRWSAATRPPSAQCRDRLSCLEHLQRPPTDIPRSGNTHLCGAGLVRAFCTFPICTRSWRCLLQRRADRARVGHSGSCRPETTSVYAHARPAKSSGRISRRSSPRPCGFRGHTTPVVRAGTSQSSVAAAEASVAWPWQRSEVRRTASRGGPSSKKRSS